MTVPFLRPLRPDDAPAVLAAFGSAPDMARQGEVRDLASARDYVTRLTGDGVRACAICVDEVAVGLVCVALDRANRNGWVSYWLHADHRGRGLVARAVATVADLALGEGGLERLELGHRENNPASGRVALAAGFVQEGVERAKFLVEGERVDVLTYGRLPSDPWPTTEHLPLTDPWETPWT